MSSSAILRRIVNATNTPDIIETLVSLKAADLHSLLLEVWSQRVLDWQERDIREQFLKSRFVTPCAVDQRLLMAFDSTAYDLLPKEFRSVELSPVAPLGLNSVLGCVSQNNVMTTSRNVEVLADPTSSLAFLCSEARRTLFKDDPKSPERVHYATSSRSIRQQPFDDIEGFCPHFRTFALSTAGRDQGHERFEEEEIRHHVSFYLDLIDRMLASGHYRASDVTARFSNIRVVETLIEELGLSRREIGRKTQQSDYSFFTDQAIDLPATCTSMNELSLEQRSSYGLTGPYKFLRMAEDSIVQPLRERYPHVRFVFDLERVAGIGYYSTLCFKVLATNERGVTLPLVDGGMSDWGAKLLHSRKERLLLSGIGSELFCNLFHV